MLAATVLAAPAEAGEPIRLDSPAGIERLATEMERYAGASRVRWSISAASAAEARRILAELAGRLGPGGSDLIERVGTTAPQASLRSLSSNLDSGVGAGPTAVITVNAGPPVRCSWSVTISDPVAPSGSRAGVQIPLETGDRVPVSDGATVEIGATGPLQFRHYAFGETRPGTIRDLAAAPEIAIPVAAETEQIVLVRTRQPVPFLDGLQVALASAPGTPKDLGRDAALAERFRSGARGIGANIQLLDPSMVIAEAPRPKPAPDAPAGNGDEGMAVAKLGDLAETCLYTLVR